MDPTTHPIDLTGYLIEKMGADELTVSGMTQIGEGMSSEIFFLDLDYVKNGEAIKEEIVIRREPSGGVLENYDLAKDFKLLKALAGGKLLVPEVLWFEPDADVFERPFYAMKKVEGEVYNLDPRLPSKLLFNDDERPTLADDFVSNIVKIHQFDWETSKLDFLGDPGEGNTPVIRQIEQHEQVIQRAGYRNHPVVSMAVNWLKQNAPEIDTVCIVHGDYRTGNYISKDARIRAVIDWEFCHLGDPHEDLAYILSPAWRSAEEGLVNHLMTESEFVQQYEKMSGIKIDPYKLMYFGAINIFRGLDIMCTAAKNFNQGLSTDLRDGVHSMTVEFLLIALMTVITILKAS